MTPSDDDDDYGEDDKYQSNDDDDNDDDDEDGDDDDHDHDDDNDDDDDGGGDGDDGHEHFFLPLEQRVLVHWPDHRQSTDRSFPSPISDPPSCTTLGHSWPDTGMTETTQTISWRTSNGHAHGFPPRLRNFNEKPRSSYCLM